MNTSFTHTAAPTRRQGVCAVHSLDRVVFTVPDLGEAQAFYQAFGLDVRRQGERLDLHTFGHPQRWASVFAGTPRKRLAYLRLGIFEADLAGFRERILAAGIEAPPHPLAEPGGLWLRNPDGVPVQLCVGPKVSPSAKPPAHPPLAVPAGEGASPPRSRIAPVRPRALSHALCFSADVPRMVAFCTEVLGLRLSDGSGDGIAFLHGAHGSEHHLLAFARSGGPGLHHTSWAVDSIDEVGNGGEQMRVAGHGQGWGVGRHVLGSNYFHYVRDPWGSWAEYSFDMDFVPHDLDWPARDHPPEDSFYAWGPAVPPDFITNHELP